MSQAAMDLQEEILVGKPVVHQSQSPVTSFAVVFEDDGDTGYFYGLDMSIKENPILDALHIYNVDQVIDKNIPSVVQIVWSGDGKKALLLINDYPHAAFNFEAQRGYCRNNFPPPDIKWTKFSHEWDDSVIDLFK